jgi:hypothetical protein
VRSAPTILSDDRRLLDLIPLAVADRHLGELEIAGVWQLESPNMFFGGYSALAALGDGRLLAVSDSGAKLVFRPPGRTAALPEFGQIVVRGARSKAMADAEALARDPASGQVWAAFEHDNMIERFDAQLRATGQVQPAEMRGWPSNAGPEAMTRLADGRFVVLSEVPPRWFGRNRVGLLFPGDPVDGAKPVRFAFRSRGGYAPSDMAVLPDGRVLILVRRVEWALPPGFRNKLLIADPRDIREGEVWPWRELADLAPLPNDNYEGLAVEPGEAGGLILWLVSDDNHASFQRTLLAKLLWRPNEKARGSNRAPRRSGG